MFSGKLDPYFVLIAIPAFGLVFSLWLIGVSVWVWRRHSRDRRVLDRLGTGASQQAAGGAAARLWRNGGEAPKFEEERSGWKALLQRVDQLCRETGLTMPAEGLLFSLAGLCTLSFLLMIALTRNPILGLGAMAVTIMIAMTYLRRRLNRFLDLFERQFVDALGLATRSLRAGHPLPAAFRLIADEMDAPISNVFGEIWQQQNLGLGIGEAILRTTSKYSSPDMRLFAAAIVIQLRTGGNLADMMDRLADVVRSRIRLHRRVRILTAQAQLSKRILIALPFLLFLVLYLVNPGYLQPLISTTRGNVLLGIAGVSLLVGSWVMNRIATLKY